jgi:hypothetical protein
MRLKTAALALIGFAAMATLACPAKAADKITYAYFQRPVELPGGKVLPQGEYAFKVVDETSTAKVVQILLALNGGTIGVESSYNGNKPMAVAATLVAVSDYKGRRTRGTVTFWPARDGANAAIRGVNFPLDEDGLIFVYPKERATELAKAANQPVPSMAENPGSDVGVIKNVALKAAAANGQDVDITEAFGKPGSRPAEAAGQPDGVHYPPGCVYEAGEVSCQFRPTEARD